MNHKSVRSAVIISPPEKFWEPIQEIRRNHDHAFVRWMPHINLLYPFVPEAVGGFKSEAEDVQKALGKRNVQPFPVLFSKESFGFFRHGKKCTIWLKPLQVKPKATTKMQGEIWLKPLQVKPKATTKMQGEAIKESPQKSDVRPVEVMAVKQEHKSPRPVEKVETFTEKIGIVEPETQTPYSQSDASIGLDSLAKAVWDDRDIHSLRKAPAVVDIGLDCLRYAVWSPGESNEYQKVTFVEKISRKPPIKYGEKSKNNQKSAVVATTPRICGEKTAGKYQRPASPVLESNKTTMASYTEENMLKKFWGSSFPDKTRLNIDTDVQEDIGWDNMTTTKVQNKRWDIITPTSKNDPGLQNGSSVECLNNSPHPEVIRLQKCLLDVFPFCNDLSTRDPSAGFQPHLTLGQCDARNVDSFIDTLKKNWKDLCFIVDCIHIISRTDKDPFKIKNSLKLGLPVK